MSTALSWIALGVSAVSLLFALLLPAFMLSPPSRAAAAQVCAAGRRERDAWRLVWIAGIVLVALLFVATLPTAAPWSPGQGMGRGFLIGAATALLAAASVAHLSGRAMASGLQPGSGALLTSGMALSVGLLSLGLLGAAAVVLVLPKDVPDALGGLALGAVLVAVLVRCSLGFRTATGSGASLEGYALFVVALSTAVSFGFHHFRPSDVGGRLAPLGAASVLVVSALVGCLLFGWVSGALRALRLTGWLASVALLVLVGGAAVQNPQSEFGAGAVAVALGVGTALVVTLLAATRGLSGGSSIPLSAEAGALQALMALGLYVVGFQILHGYGVGLALLGAWAPGIAALGALCWSEMELAAAAGSAAKEAARAVAVGVATGLMRFLGVVCLALLFRLFLERRTSAGPDMNLTVHFTFVGLVVGAVVPMLVEGGLRRAAARASRVAAAAGRNSLLTSVALGFWALALPGALGVACGTRALVGLLAGLVLGSMYALLLLLEVGASVSRGGTLLALLGTALVAIQAAPILAPLAVMHRSVRVTVLAAVALIGLVWLVLGGHSGSEASELDGASNQDRSPSRPNPGVEGHDDGST